MPSDKKKLTFKGQVEKLVEPHRNVKDIKARQQARITALAGLILAVTSLLVGTGLVLANLQLGLVITFFVLAIVMVVAFILGRTEIYLVGSILLVSGVILTGFVLSSTTDSVTIGVLFLLSTIVPALSIGIVLLPFLGILIVAVSATLIIGILPIMTNMNVNTALLIFLSLIIIDAVFILAATIRDNIENQQLEEVGNLRGRLEERLDERTRYSRIAADIAEEIVSVSSLEELLNLSVNLINGRFGFSFTRVFLTDEQERQIILKAVQGAGAEKLLGIGKRITIGPPSLLGWVAENKQHHVASTTIEDPLQLEADLLPDSQSEIGIPILSKNQLLGVLDAQSALSSTFESNEIIVILQMLANQIAAAIQNVRLLNVEQSGIQEVTDIYFAGYKVVQAKAENEIYQVIQELFPKTSYISMLLINDGKEFKTTAKNEAQLLEGQSYPDAISLSTNELEPFLETGVFIGEANRLSSLPYNLVRVLRQLRIFSVAVVPVMYHETITAIFVIGTREKQPLVITNIHPYATLAKQIEIASERIRESQKTERRVAEMETITLVSQEISTIRDLDTLYRTLHAYLRQALGDVNFQVNIYNADTNSISVPYMFETSLDGGSVTKIDTYPLGEGLTSILIRTKQPLMLVEDLEGRATALGAKISGTLAKSWLGTPLVVSGEVIGAIVVQDVEREYAFDDNDLRFLTTLSTQVAGAIFNTRLLGETRGRAIQLQTAAEIARDISGSLDLGELLNKAVTLIRERFNFYHSAVFLIDSTNEFAVVREATGEAGIQMKRAAHKLKVGSKSIVGFVTSSGDPLVVNDTYRDAIYFANPLLPETRAEAAIPLKVGTRILGALDVQSTQPYSFNKEDVSVLRILADQLAIAVINSELFADTQENLSQQRLLHHVTTAAASGSTLEEALSGAVQGLQVTLGGDRVSILLADKEKKMLTIKSFAGYSDEVEQLEIPFGEGITGWVAAHQQLKRVNDVTQEAHYIQVDPSVCSELAVPLSYRGELLGVLNVESDQVGAYNENDEEMLGTLGGSLAAVISNARLIEQVRRQVERERTLFEVTSKIRRSTDMQTIMATTASELSKALGARRAKIKIDIGNESNPGKSK